MSIARPLTRDIGQAERPLRALLERELDHAGLSFAQWTVLVFLDTEGPLTQRELIRRQLAGRVATEVAAGNAVDALRAAGLIASPADDGESPLALTPAGEEIFQPARRAVARITDDIHRDLPAADVEATQRTLAEIARRANQRLTSIT